MLIFNSIVCHNYSLEIQKSESIFDTSVHNDGIRTEEMEGKKGKKFLEPKNSDGSGVSIVS